MARLQTLAPRLASVRAGPGAAPLTSSARRLRGSAWVALRAEILRRDCGLCQVCKRAGRVTLARDVDHVHELADGGTDDTGNLEAICGPCHVAKTAAAQRARLGIG